MSILSAGRTEQLCAVLEALYEKYNRFELIEPDPLQFVYRYSRPDDMEIVGLLASVLAYGRVQQIEKSVSNLLGRMGKSPHEFTLNFRPGDRKRLADFKHRFTSGDAISDLIESLHDALTEFGSIEACFIAGCNQDDDNILDALSVFCRRLLGTHRQHSGAVSQGLMYLLTDPANKSACKRLNMFLRWMVRDDDVDSGLWKSIDKAKLIVPVDTHMARLCKILGLYERKTVNLNTAVEITGRFAEIEPADPVKYDFALSRIGIVEDCTGRYHQECNDCALFKSFCQARIL